MNELSTIILHSTEAIFAIDLAGNVTFWNDSCEKLFGYNEKEVAGNFLPIMSDASAYELDAIIERTKQNKSVTFKTQKRTKDGTVLDLVITTHPLFQDTKLIGIGAIVQKAAVLKNVTFMPYNLSPFVRESKRTFIELRNQILFSLSKGRMTINQVANDSGVNWKTVEKHLTYLIGKKLVSEIFSSEYVRIFELTSQGKDYLEQLKKEGPIKVTEA